MRIERVVVNASPLITLFRAGLHPLLPQLFTDLSVPEAVWTEVISGNYADPAAHGLPQWQPARRIEIQAAPQVLIWNLGAGETAVLSYALQHPDCWALVDDRAARRCGHVLNLRLLGTAGVVVLAKRRGLIESVETELRRLQTAGLWLSEELIVRLSASEDGK